MVIDPGSSALRRHYNPSPLIDSAGGRGLALYRFVALVYAGILVGVHREHVILWWPIVVFFVVVVLQKCIHFLFCIAPIHVCEVDLHTLALILFFWLRKNQVLCVRRDGIGHFALSNPAAHGIVQP